MSADDIARMQAQQAAEFARLQREVARALPGTGLHCQANKRLEELRALDSKRRAELGQMISENYETSPHPFRAQYEQMRYGDSLDDACSLAHLRGRGR